MSSSCFWSRCFGADGLTHDRCLRKQTDSCLWKQPDRQMFLKTDGPADVFEPYIRNRCSNNRNICQTGWRHVWPIRLFGVVAVLWPLLPAPKPPALERLCAETAAPRRPTPWKMIRTSSLRTFTCPSTDPSCGDTQRRWGTWYHWQFFLQLVGDRGWINSIERA